jgi:CHAD domain-containing protein
MDELDDLRDTQVILAEISESVQHLPQLRGFQKQQRHLEAKLLKNLRKLIKKFQTKELTRRIRKTHESLETESPEGFEVSVMRAVDDAYRLDIQRLELVQQDRPATIHPVRIAFKSFRYVVEMIHSLLDGYPEALLKQMHDYQTRMGDVQDAEVFMQTLRDYAESASILDLETVRRYYEHRHAEAIAAYVEAMDELRSFWRAASDQPFPWEMST